MVSLTLDILIIVINFIVISNFKRLLLLQLTYKKYVKLQCAVSIVRKPWNSGRTIFVFERRAIAATMYTADGFSNGISVVAREGSGEGVNLDAPVCVYECKYVLRYTNGNTLIDVRAWVLCVCV